MYLMYVDESGDIGLVNSPTRYFILSGIVIHELKWREFLDNIYLFRKRLKARYGLGIRNEIHSSEFVRSGNNDEIRKHDRLAIIRNFADELSKYEYIRVTNIVIDKQGKPADFDVFGVAWRALFQRFENTINARNFPGPKNSEDKGLVFCDNTDGGKLCKITRKMRSYNPVASKFGGFRNVPITSFIEDPNLRDSKDSYLIQAADLCSFLLQQFLQPNGYFRKYGAKNYFKKLAPILNTKASTSNEWGIVYL